MNKIFILGLFALLAMQACKKDQELIEGKRPDERMAADLEKYRNELVNSPNGWVAYLGTTYITGSYNFYMSFDKENKVVMAADFDSDIAAETFQSTYRIKQVMSPSLIFDTYNFLHLLQDPDPSFFDGELAVGYGSDFEFEIREQVGDTIKMVGKKRNASLILVKATAADKAFYTTDQFSQNIEAIVDYLSDFPFTYILDPKDPGRKIQVSLNPDVQSRSFSFISANGTQIVRNSGLFSFSREGLRLSQPIQESGVTFKDLLWDAAAKKLFLITSTGAKIELLVSSTPILPLNLVLGTAYTAIVVPGVTNSAGWGPEFVTRRASAATSVGAFSVGGVPLKLDKMTFSFNTVNQLMTITVVTTYGASNLSLPYPYTYTKTPAGIYKFTLGVPTGNAAALASALGPLLAQRINVDTFVLDYFVNPANGQVLGQFKSVEHPDFYFTGTLQ